MIADDHRLVAEGIARLIDESKVAKVVAITDSISGVRELISDGKACLLLLDVALPDGDGIDAIRQFKAIMPSLRVIVLSTYAEPAVIRRAVESDADGYILKSADINELIEGIQVVGGGSRYVCKTARRLLIGSEAPPELTAREKDILRLLVDGYTMKEVAQRLNLGFETVHSYTKSMRQKLGCSNMQSLVRTAIEHHLV